MEHENPLPCSQKPSIGSFPEMNAIHILPKYFSKIYFNIIFPTTQWLSGLEVLPKYTPLLAA
jgi:hypothetical protein